MTITVSPKRVAYSRKAPSASRAEHWKAQTLVFWGPDGGLLQMGAYKPKAISWGKAMDNLKSHNLASEWATDYLRENPISLEWASGDDIHEVYRKYRDGSCMRYDECHDMRTLYANNPDSVGLAYWKKGSHPALESNGSVLVWLGEKGAYVDRVYTQGFAYPADIIRGAIGKAIGAMFPELKVTSIYANGLGLAEAGKVTLKGLLPPDGNLLPYCDTMRFSWDGRRLTVSNKDGFEAKRTDGTTLDGDDNQSMSCCCCDCDIDDDDARYTDNGDGPYCDECYSDRYAYCERSQCDYPIDDIHERSFLLRGRVYCEYVSDEWLSSNCEEYAGIRYADEITHIAQNDATEIDGVGYVSDDEIQDRDCEVIDDNCTWVDPYFGDACALDDCHYEKRIGGWVPNDIDEEFILDYVRLCKMADCAPDGLETPKYYVGSFYVTTSMTECKFEIRHKVNGGSLIPYLFDLDSALLALGWIIGQLDNYGISSLFSVTMETLQTEWSAEKGERLRDLLHAWQYRRGAATLWRVDYPTLTYRRGYGYQQRGTMYVHAHGGVKRAYDALLRNISADCRKVVEFRSCYFSPVN